MKPKGKTFYKIPYAHSSNPVIVIKNEGRLTNYHDPGNTEST